MERLELLVVILMVFVNAVFAAYEIALASVTVSRLQVLASRQRRGATAALQMKEDIERSLAVVQLGITLVGLLRLGFEKRPALSFRPRRACII